MAYQSFGGEKGNSDSRGKFDALKLTPELLHNKKVLDIGCNEGYFCFKAKELGAKKVVGIDKNQKWVDLANKRNNNEDTIFLNTDTEYLKEIDSGSIDMVFTLSTMHYLCDPEMRDEKDIPIFINQIRRILKDGGIWVFEGGVDQQDTNEFVQLKRGIGDTVYHPTRKKIESILNSIFSHYKYIGPSVKQGGDPVPRFVYYGYK